ncbi:MAG: hypothetical protein ACRDCE_06120 [Cetobacterium sp.]|uniref:hypothetical protein n=1 Tax=Cetobacterium sp. TaxID=2071632 RepID=UPI003EE8169A
MEKCADCFLLDEISHRINNKIITAINKNKKVSRKINKKIDRKFMKLLRSAENFEKYIDSLS